MILVSEQIRGMEPVLQGKDLLSKNDVMRDDPYWHKTL
jgi:hypothetical protein